MKKALLILVTSIPLFLTSCLDIDDDPCGPAWNKNVHYNYGDIVTYKNYCWRAYRENINIGPGSDSNYVWLEYVEVEDDDYSSNSCNNYCDDYYSWDGSCSCHCH